MKKRIAISLFLAICLLVSLLQQPAMAVSEGVSCHTLAADVALDGAGRKLETAKAVLLYELNTDTLVHGYNVDKLVNPTGLVKLLTVLVALEKGDLEDIVTVKQSTLNTVAVGSVSAKLKSGEEISLRDLLLCIMVASANDACAVVAAHVGGSQAGFVAMMNEKAAQLGMKDTHFVNCTGLDDDPNAQQHLTSAYDIALMSRELMLHHPDIKKFTTIWMDTIRGGTFGLANTNKLIRFYRGATGLKTGFTSAAGYCLSATAQREDLELIAVVMGAESSQDRFNACKQLLDYGFANFALVRPQPQGVHSVEVKLGKVDFVTVRPAEDAALLVDKGQKNQVDIQVELEQRVTAPISQGQRLGTLTVRVGDQILRQIPMVAAEGVQKKNFWDVFVDVLRQIAMAA